jgi:hypothetical protein
MLDSDLADLYQIETGSLKRAVRRNSDRFPEDFMFPITWDELELLKCQSGISIGSRSENRGGTRYLPFAFTEGGVAMLTTILRNETARQVNISILRTFRFFQHDNGRFETQDLTNRLTRLEERMDRLEKGKFPPSGSISSRSCSKVEIIQQCVSEFFELDVNTLKLSTREKRIALPRHIAIYLIRTWTHMGYKEIGTYFGGQNHATVFHAVQKVQRSLESVPEIKDTINAISRRLSNIVSLH